MTTSRYGLRAAVAVALIAGLSSASTPAHAQVKFEMQARIDALNLFGLNDNIDNGLATVTPVFNVVPMVEMGARLLSDKLFIGVGFGYGSVHTSDCDSLSDGGCSNDETETTRTSWSLSPMVSYEPLSTKVAGLYVLGWFNFGQLASFSQTRHRANQPDTITERDGDFWFGFNIGLGLRAKVFEALSIGTEWGWGFAVGSDGRDDQEDSAFTHGIWGTIVLAVALDV